MQRKIVDFYRNEQDHWVAQLECGHAQTVRHNPPWINRRWILREETRRQRIGRTLNCRSCDEATEAPQSRPAASQARPRRQREPGGKPRTTTVRYLRGRSGRRSGPRDDGPGHGEPRPRRRQTG